VTSSPHITLTRRGNKIQSLSFKLGLSSYTRFFIIFMAFFVSSLLGRHIMFERFTERARYVVVLAQEESRGLKHREIGSQHLLLGMIREEEGAAALVLRTLGVELEPARASVVKMTSAKEGPTSGQIPFTSAAKNILEASLREALRLRHQHIGTEHILLGLVRRPDYKAVLILEDDFGLSREQIRDEVMRVISRTPR
jgi:ATP-dependent Clp protease ATP-binding subunit ClpC